MDTVPGWAWVDESFEEERQPGFYVLAAAVVPPDTIDDARDAMRELRRRLPGRGKLHWNQMTSVEQDRAAQVVADLGELHVVVTGSPVTPRRQNRARAMCMRRMAYELHGLVDGIVAESRGPKLDRGDVESVTRARQTDLPKGARLRIEHRRGVEEPLLWIADVVAGATRLHRLGQPGPRTLLEACTYEIDLELDL